MLPGPYGYIGELLSIVRLCVDVWLSPSAREGFFFYIDASGGEV
jgi:hypothetical protein